MLRLVSLILDSIGQPYHGNLASSNLPEEAIRTSQTSILLHAYPARGKFNTSRVVMQM